MSQREIMNVDKCLHFWNFSWLDLATPNWRVDKIGHSWQVHKTLWLTLMWVVENAIFRHNSISRTQTQQQIQRIRYFSVATANIAVFCCGVAVMRHSRLWQSLYVGCSPWILNCHRWACRKDYCLEIWMPEELHYHCKDRSNWSDKLCSLAHTPFGVFLPAVWATISHSGCFVQFC